MPTLETIDKLDITEHSDALNTHALKLSTKIKLPDVAVVG